MARSGLRQKERNFLSSYYLHDQFGLGQVVDLTSAEKMLREYLSHYQPADIAALQLLVRKHERIAVKRRLKQKSRETIIENICLKKDEEYARFVNSNDDQVLPPQLSGNLLTFGRFNGFSGCSRSSRNSAA